MSRVSTRVAIADASWPGEQVDKSLVPMSRMTISGSKSRTSESCVIDVKERK